MMAGCSTKPAGRILGRMRLIHALVVLAFVAACGDREDLAGRLPGTWLEEAEVSGEKISRVVALKQGGTFEQATKLLGSGGATRIEITAGEWYFDGETFKRRYRTVDGRRVSGIQFTSYQVVSLTDSELACIDHLTEGKRNVRFRRVPEGTTP